jgi:hypothetical protein
VIVRPAIMTQLILKRASASRLSGEWNEDDFDVLADGAVVGRILRAAAAPVGLPWKVGRLSPATGGHVSTTCRKGRRCRRQERTPRLGRRLRRGRQQHRGSSYKRVNGMSRFRTRLEGSTSTCIRRSQWRSARRQRKHCTGALPGEARSRRTLAIAILVWLEAL